MSHIEARLSYPRYDLIPVRLAAFRSSNRLADRFILFNPANDLGQGSGTKKDVSRGNVVVVPEQQLIPEATAGKFLQ